MMRLFLLIMLFICFQSCNTKSNTEVKYSFEESIDDASLSKLIKSYVVQTHMDTTKAVLCISLSGCEEEKKVIVDNTVHDPFLFLEKPTGYSIISGYLVIIFNSASLSLPKEEIKDELKQRLLQFKIKLKDELTSTYDPVQWMMIKKRDSVEVKYRIEQVCCQ